MPPLIAARRAGDADGRCREHGGRKERSAVVLAAIHAMADPDPDRRAQRQSVVEQGIRSPHARKGILTLQKMLIEIDAAVSEKPFLCGDDYSLADASVTPFVSRLNELALDWMWSDLPGVARWWDRIRARPSFDTVFGAFPNPDRIRRLKEAGQEAKPAVEDILAAEA